MIRLNRFSSVLPTAVLFLSVALMGCKNSAVTARRLSKNYNVAPLVEASPSPVNLACKAYGLCNGTKLSFKLITKDEFRYAAEDLLGVTHDQAIPLTEGWSGAPTVSGLDTVTGESVSPKGIDDRVTGAERVAELVPNSPVISACLAKGVGDNAWSACAATFGSIAERAFRRALSADETAAMKALYNNVYGVAGTMASVLGDRTPNGEAAKAVVQYVFSSPEFQFKRIDAPGTAKGRALGPYEIASRLAYALRASVPDDALMVAAKSGALSDRAEVKKQATRLLKDPKKSFSLREKLLREMDARRFPPECGS